MSFRAKYPGRCLECAGDIDEGDLLDYDADRRVVHILCVDGDPLDLARDICPDCYIELPVAGVCGVC